MSKQAKWIMGIIVGLLLVAVAFTDVWTRSAGWFKGERTKNPDLYSLQITSMNGKDSHTMHANKGQKIVLKYDITSGRANIEIAQAGKPAIYEEKEIKQAALSFEVQEEGDYTVTVRTKRAKGKITVEIQNPYIPD